MKQEFENKVCLVRQHGSYDALEWELRHQIWDPSVQAHHVLIRVKACGLNHLDTWVRRGVPGHKFPLPLVPGSDVTGVVVAVGDAVSQFSKGDRVLVNPTTSCGECEICISGQDHLCSQWGLLGETQDGGCQEYVIVHKRNLSILPIHLSFEQGASIPVAYVTAWEMLVEKAKIQPGETILIHAAGSGVSLACLQIAKLFGLQIIVTSTSQEKLQKAKVLGAHRFLNTDAKDFNETIKMMTHKKGVDVVVDHVGEATFSSSLKSLKKGGRLVSCGATSGSQLQLDWKFIFFKNIALLGSTYGPRHVFHSVLKQFEYKTLHAVIDQILSIDKISEAHQLIESKKVFGKIILQFPQSLGKHDA